MATIKNGTSRYDIKGYMVNSVAPKYFDKIPNLSDLNVGLFGYITEILSDTTNDVFFTVSSMYKEMYPQLAELPESIYNHALIYQLSNIFGAPACANFSILVAEDSVLSNSTVDGSFSYFDIDSNLVINIDSVPFMLDYDIRIISKNTTSGWVHSAQYIMDKKNDLSDLNNPYIRSTIFVADNGKRYIALQVKVRQVFKKTYSDLIITNDVINVVQLEYMFSDQLANFDVYYKAPNTSTYIQLKKLLRNSTSKPDAPFCYYKLSDNDKLQITFSSSDGYFKPEYNSEIIVEIYTTTGSAGNFDEYSGDSISIAPRYDKYSSNRGVVFMGTVVGPSTGGFDRMSLKELQNATVKSYSTVKSFSTTNDLNLYFDEIRDKSTQKSQIQFMRKRDDVFERLYSAFILFRDSDNNIVPTNTLDLRISSKNTDYRMVQTGRNIVKAGKLFKYMPDNENPYAAVIDDKYTDDLDKYENTNDFVYVNPFLTIINTDPLGVSFYLNTVNDTIPVTSVNINSNSLWQFIVDTVNVKRDALLGEDKYKFSVKMSPTAALELEPFTLIEDDTPIPEGCRTFDNDTDNHSYIDNDNLKVLIEVLDSNKDRAFFVELKLVKFDTEYYYYEGSIKTNDYISSNGEVQIIDGFKTADKFDESDLDPILVPCVDCMVRVHVLYKYPDGTIVKETEFNQFEALKDFSLTNTYTVTEDQQMVNLVLPIQEIRSYIQYSVREASGAYGFRLEAVPLIKANYLKLSGCRESFITSFKTMYEYLEESLQKLTNNYSVDIKFFNTYGYSQHYFIADNGNDETHIDKVNITLKFRAKLNINSNVEAEVEEIKAYIKGLVENTDISLVSSPSFYCSTIVNACMQKFSTITYLTFIGLNNYDATIQALESDVNEYNIINGNITTSTIIPEYLNIDYLIKDGIRTSQIYIEVV